MTLREKAALEHLLGDVYEALAVLDNYLIQVPVETQPEQEIGVAMPNAPSRGFVSDPRIT